MQDRIWSRTSMNEITEHVTCEDPRAAAFLNEVKVITTLARNDNKPKYVARIASLPPKIKPFRGDEIEATRPGIKSACVRLEGTKILRSEVKAGPKRARGGTAHYSIVPDLDTFFLIMDKLGPGVLEEVRSSNFGASVITADIYHYLAKQLNVDEAKILEHRTELETVIFLTKSSTKALAFLLTYARPMAATAEENRGFDLEGAIVRLVDVTHLAFLYDMASSTVTKGGMEVESKISSNIDYGSMRLSLNSYLLVSKKEIKQ